MAHHRPWIWIGPAQERASDQQFCATPYALWPVLSETTRAAALSRMDGIAKQLLARGIPVSNPIHRTFSTRDGLEAAQGRLSARQLFS
jgi:hypothetical protein